MTERRNQNRLICADLVRVEWTEAGNRIRVIEGVLEDIAPAGACIQVDNPIPQGAAVRMALRDWQFLGSVRYCIHRDCSYFVGLRFSEQTVWSRSGIEPAHLTDLREIAAKLRDSRQPL